MQTNLQLFAAVQRDLISKEKACEVEEMAILHKNFQPYELQKRGLALIGLSVTAMRTGLGGKCLVDLEGGPGVNNLPAHKFSSGDIVSVQEAAGRSRKGESSTTTTTTGVVYRVHEGKIILAFKDELPEDLKDRCSIYKMANEVTYERMKKAMDLLEKFANDGTANSMPILQTLFSKKSVPSFSPSRQVVEYYDDSLNPSQREAVEFALSAREVALIHGPPGTGKTHTCVELIRQLVKRGERVLVCGPSNISVDNLVDRLSKTKLDIVRVGHPARILDSVLQHALEVRIRSSEEGQIVNDVRAEMDQVLKGLSKCKSRQERRTAYGEIKSLRKEFREREFKVVDGILRNAQVVLSTLNGSSSHAIEKCVQFCGLFDTILIDEATQALEAECWIAITKGKKLILAGDHLQLPPTVKSLDSKTIKTAIKKPKKTTSSATSSSAEVINNSSDEGMLTLPDSLEFTLFDRLLQLHGKKIKRLLNVQYRANEIIMKYSSKSLYDGELVSHDSVKDRLLVDLKDVKETEDTIAPLVFIDTSGCQLYESTEEENTFSSQLVSSKLNEGEAQLVVEHVHKLIKAGLKDLDIAVISPYNAQVNLVTSLLKQTYPQLEVGTVDGFQGREKEAVVISLVRSNDKGEIGFLSEKRRLNVAITRAKRHLCVVCDSETLARGKEPFLKGFIDFAELEGEIRFPS